MVLFWFQLRGAGRKAELVLSGKSFHNVQTLSLDQIQGVLSRPDDLTAKPFSLIIVCHYLSSFYV
jgi:hypothetical protein